MRRYFLLSLFWILSIGCNRREEEPIHIVSPYYNNIKELHKRIGICDSNFPENRSPYYLDVFMMRDLPSDQAGYIFRINSCDNNDWEYIFYTKKGSDWRFAGYIDKISQFYTEPLQRYESTGHYNWFVVKYVSCEGTGIYEESEEWYDLAKIPIKPVLKYMTEMNSTTFCDGNPLVKYTVLSNDLNIDNAVPVLTLKAKIAIYKTK